MGTEQKPEVERVYSTTEAKNQFSSILNFVEGSGGAAVIESHGRPRAAVISLEEFETFKKLKKQERREQGLKRIRKLREEARALNQDLTDESAEELIASAMDEAFQELHDSGRLYKLRSIAR
jgi:prevent-host-death family protein